MLSVGDQVDPQQIRPAPNNAIIVKRAPELELLKQTSVCITHAGLNTVLESLAQGVPQVAIPVAFDQPGGRRTNRGKANRCSHLDRQVNRRSPFNTSGRGAKLFYLSG